MSKKLIKGIVPNVLALLFVEPFLIQPAFSQSSQQTAEPASNIDGDFNNVFQNPSQNNAQNSNINEFNVPINTPVNTENDFGFNMSVGVNTLDASNVTVYFGLIYQPGRTDSHNTRMDHLKKETEILEVQRQIAEAQLQQLHQQIAEQEIRLQRLREPEIPPPLSDEQKPKESPIEPKPEVWEEEQQTEEPETEFIPEISP